MKYLGVVFLSGLFFGFSGIANAASPTIDDVYQMLLKQQEKIASLEANQRSLERDVTKSKLREARLRDDLHKAETQLASVQKAASNDFGEPTYDAPQREEGFVASAGLLYVMPNISHENQGEIADYDLGFNISASYQDANNVDFSINYKHFATDDVLLKSQSGVPVTDKYTVNYDALDFETGKTLQLSDSVSMRLSGGLRYASINENTIIQSVGCGLTCFAIDLGGESNLWGVGIKAGIAPEWNPNNSNFRIFSSLSGAYLAGKWDDKLTSDANSSLFSMVDASVGVGYLLPTSIGDIEIKASYQYELLDTANTNTFIKGNIVNTSNNFEYRGYHGLYGSIGYAFGDMN